MQQPSPQSSSGPRTIKTLLTRLMARTGYDCEQATSGLLAAWQEAAPEALRGNSRPGTIRRGVLDVFVTHSAHVQEMGFHKSQVLVRLNKLLPEREIHDIRCRIGADASTHSSH